MAFVISAPTDERLNPWKIVHLDQVDLADHHVVQVAAGILGERAVHPVLVAAQVVAASLPVIANPVAQVVRRVVVAPEAASQLDQVPVPLLGDPEVIVGAVPQLIANRVIVRQVTVLGVIVRLVIVLGVIVRLVIVRVMIGMALIGLVRIVALRVIVHQVTVLGVIVRETGGVRERPAARCRVGAVAVIVRAVTDLPMCDRVRIVHGEGDRNPIVTHRTVFGRSGQVHLGSLTT